MSQRTRIWIAIIAIIVIVGLVLGLEAIRRSTTTTAAEDLDPGDIPIYLSGMLAGGFNPDDLAQLEEVSFVDDEEGKEQHGWLLRDVVLLYVDETSLSPATALVVSSSSREKSVQVDWAEVTDEVNFVMFDLSGRGTLKLVSKGLADLDIRDEWVQDVDKIEITGS